MHWTKCLWTMLLGCCTLVTVSAVNGAERIPLKHPTFTNEDLRACTVCHDTDTSFPFVRYNHTLLFGQKHAAPARSNPAVCEMCHEEKSCLICHSGGAGLKPEVKWHGDPRPQTPHRGDYLTRHRIDGRLDPTTCFRCHGSPKTAKRCSPCHH